MITNEIERRYLMKRIPTPNVDPGKFDLYIVNQFYTEDGWRYRDRLNAFKGKSDYFKTKKKKASEGFMEEEYEITREEFDLANIPNLPRISKKRLVYYSDNLKFEIDQFVGMDLILMEVEIESMSYNIVFPDFIKKEILLEVTGIKELSNRRIALSEVNR